MSDSNHHYPGLRVSETSDMSKRSGVSSPLILVIEDNQDMRCFICENIYIECKVIAVAEGQKGLESAFEKTPDLIISDVMMPGMDGLTLVRHLKQG